MVRLQHLKINFVLLTLVFSWYAQGHSTEVDVASADPCFDADDHALCAVVLLQRRAELLTTVPEISGNSSIHHEVSGNDSTNHDVLEQLLREPKLVEVVVASLDKEMEAQCEIFCANSVANNAKSWSEVCKWKACAGCDDCQGSRSVPFAKSHDFGSTVETATGHDRNVTNDSVRVQADDNKKGVGEKRSKLGNRSRWHARRKRGLEDVAVGVISGRPEYYGPVHWSVLAYVPKGMILEAPGKCNCNFRAGFARLIHDRPNASWYYVGDDDAFIYLERLQSILDKYDPSVPTLLANPGSSGTFAEYCGDAKPIKKEDGTVLAETFYGGTGFIVSRALAKRINFGAECTDTLDDMKPNQLSIASDHDLSCLLAESWEPSYKYIELPAVHGNACEMTGDCENLDNLDAKFKFAQELDWPAPIAVVHHLSPDKIEAMAKYNENVSAGRYWKRTAKLWDNTGHCMVNPARKTTL